MRTDNDSRQTENPAGGISPEDHPLFRVRRRGESFWRQSNYAPPNTFPQRPDESQDAATPPSFVPVP